VIVVFPPLAIAMSELEILMDGIEAAIAEVTGKA